MPSAPALAQALRFAGLRVHVGPVVTTEGIVWGTRRARVARDGAVAADLESYWLLKNLAHHEPSRRDGLHAGVVRVVLDGPRRGAISGNPSTSLVKSYRALAHVSSGIEAWASALGPRTVLIASPRSFCTGVRRAIESTEEALTRHGAPIYVLHEIVHNKHVVDSLRSRGVVFVPDVSEVPEGETVVFSAHGVGQSVRENAARRHLHVIDATCPLVARVHAKAKSFARRGHQVVLIGKKGHDEVEGVVGEAPDSIHLVEGPEDIERLDLDGDGQIALLTQTTLIPHQVEGLVQRLAERFPRLTVPSALDVCLASQRRQEAVRRIAPQCDLLLVLGSPNSSNSKRLVEEAKRMGPPSHLVDDESEVDPAWLAGVRTLGLTAGASAPESLLERMIAFLETLGPVQVQEEAAPAGEDTSRSDMRSPRWVSR